MSEQQSAATEEVSASTEQMNALVQHMSAQAQELATTAGQLTQLVARFKLDVYTGDTAVTAPPAKAAPSEKIVSLRRVS